MNSYYDSYLIILHNKVHSIFWLIVYLYIYRGTILCFAPSPQKHTGTGLHAPTHTTRPTTPARHVHGRTAAAEHASTSTGARTRPRRFHRPAHRTRHARPRRDTQTRSRPHTHEPSSWAQPWRGYLTVS